MKKFIQIILALSIFLSSHTYAQTDWNKIDFSKEYKVDTKIQGAVAKSLKNGPTFINDYSIVQASLMKGSSKAGTLQKQGVGTVFAEAALAGISPDEIQALIGELYESFVNDLKNAGLNVINGDELLQTKYVQAKKNGKNVLIGKTDGNYDNIRTGAISVSDIKEHYVFRPEGNNVFVKSGIPGNFYQNLASKEATNLISIEYTIRFANFEGSRSGTSKNSLTTSAGLMVTPVIRLINPKGSYSWIVYEKSIDGNNDWSNGLIEKSSSDGSLWGLSSNADYAIQADQDKYKKEVKDIIVNLQKDIVEEIKSAF